MWDGTRAVCRSREEFRQSSAVHLRNRRGGDREAVDVRFHQTLPIR